MVDMKTGKRIAYKLSTATDRILQGRTQSKHGRRQQRARWPPGFLHIVPPMCF